MKITVEANSLTELIALLEALKASAAKAGNLPTLVIDLNVSARTKKVLLAEGIETVEQVKAMSERELLTLPNLGRKSCNELMMAIHTKDPA